MGTFSFFAFLRNPVYIVIAFFACVFLAPAIWNTDIDRFPGLFVFLFLVIVPWGYAIGGIVAENQHCLITWTLPHFRTRLMAWSIIVGIFSVVLWTVALIFSSLNASWSTILLVNLGFYCIGFASGGWDFGNRPVLIYQCQFFIGFLSVVLAWFWKELLAFGEQQPLGLALIAFAIAVGTYYLAFNQTTFRRKPFSFVPSQRATLFSKNQEMQKREILKRRKTSAKVWPLNHIGTGIFNWLRAGRYENSSGSPHGLWLFPGVGVALITLSCFIIQGTNVFGLLNPSPYDFEMLPKMIYHLVFYFNQLSPDSTIFISFPVLFAIWIYISCILNPPFFLKRGYVYPLSRTQQMWIRYCGLLVENISLFLAPILALCILGILAGAMVGFASEGVISLGILHIFAWIGVVMIPMLQWLQVKYHLDEFQGTRRQMWGIVFMILTLIVASVILGFISLLRGRYPDLTLTYEVPILFVCFIFFQWFLLSRLKRYYATRDLVL